MATEKKVNIVGLRVKEARGKHKPPMTQDQLSGKLALLGVSIDRAGISKIEIGQRSVLDYEVRGLAKALGVTTEWLLSGK
ncbi:MAG: helix-turn-helix transcriptional regulator [Flavobacteriales bacterium]|nr:helix-turn-helix transcriptional regulator [Flavobacteriales bacterium]